MFCTVGVFGGVSSLLCFLSGGVVEDPYAVPMTYHPSKTSSSQISNVSMVDSSDLTSEVQPALSSATSTTPSSVDAAAIDVPLSDSTPTSAPTPIATPLSPPPSRATPLSVLLNTPSRVGGRLVAGGVPFQTNLSLEDIRLRQFDLADKVLSLFFF